VPHEHGSGKSILAASGMKKRKNKYRRNLPHIEKDDRPHFITFDTLDRWVLPPEARDLVMEHCLHDNGTKMQLHVAVVMPDHVHLIFTPLRCETSEMFTFEEILGGIKGASSHTINKALHRTGHVWQDESFDHVTRCLESLEQKIQYVWENPVRAGLVKMPEDYKWLWREPKKK
jgi:REP element-mobilizing transposase RayT